MQTVRKEGGENVIHDHCIAFCVICCNDALEEPRTRNTEWIRRHESSNPANNLCLSATKLKNLQQKSIIAFNFHDVKHPSHDSEHYCGLSTSTSLFLNIKTNNSLKEDNSVAALKPLLGKVDTSLPRKRISLFFRALICRQG